MSDDSYVESDRLNLNIIDSNFIQEILTFQNILSDWLYITEGMAILKVTYQTFTQLHRKLIHA